MVEHYRTIFHVSCLFQVYQSEMLLFVCCHWKSLKIKGERKRLYVLVRSLYFLTALCSCETSVFAEDAFWHMFVT